MRGPSRLARPFRREPVASDQRLPRHSSRRRSQVRRDGRRIAVTAHRLVEPSERARSRAATRAVAETVVPEDKAAAVETWRTRILNASTRQAGI